MEGNVEESTPENEECSSFLDVELETLQSIYINETVVQKYESVTTVSIDLHPSTADNLHEQYVKMTLILNIKEEYPKVIPEVDIRNPRGLSDEKLNSITENLIEIAESKRGSSMLFEIIEAAKDHLTAENRPCEECAICLYGFHEEDVFTKTECYHYFHSHCLARYSRNFYLKEEEEESTSEEENVKNQLLCPVCRFPIYFEDSEESYPLPISGDEQFELTESILDLQKKMSELYSKQVEKGGIIDVEAEKNKFLLEIADVPSETETAHSVKLEDSDVKITDVVDVSSSPTCVSPGENEKKPSQTGNIKSGKDDEKSVQSNSENTKNSKFNEEKRPFKELRGERMGRDKNYAKERNEKHNSNRGSNRFGNHYTNDRNSYQKNNRYNNERRNNWYEREPPNNRYDNDRRNDRYRGDRKNERYGNDRYNNDTRNDRYSNDTRYRNDRYNGDTRNDRYGGDQRNERYDRRVDKYDQRFVRHDDRRHNRFEREHFRGNFKNGNFQRRNRTQDNYGDETNHLSDNKPDQLDSLKNENPDSLYAQEPDSNGHDGSVDYEIEKQNDWGNDEREEYKNDKPRDFENDQQDFNTSRLGEGKNTKSSERSYQPRNRRNERQDYRLNGSYNDARYNNRKDNRFDSNRKNYRQNGSRTEFQDCERKNRFARGRGRYQQSDRNDMHVKSEEREDEDISISPEIGRDENVSDSLCVYDSENSQFVEGISEVQTNYIKDEENAISREALVTETSNSRKDSFSGKNYGTNRTNKDSYKKWNYGHNTNYPKGKKYNSSNAYQKNAGFHSQLKHSESQNSENYYHDCDDFNSTKADDVGKENTSHNEVSGSKSIKNNGVEHSDSQSFRKNYRRTNSSNSKRGQPNSYRNFAEENSRCEEEFQQELQKDSPKYTPRTSNRRYPQRKYKEDNYEKSSNVQNASAIEAESDLKTKENPVHKNIPVEESPQKGSDVKSSVPTSNFLPPLSSVPPPPGFQNPSRKIVYGLAAANPPPGFNRS